MDLTVGTTILCAFTNETALALAGMSQAHTYIATLSLTNTLLEAINGLPLNLSMLHPLSVTHIIRKELRRRNVNIQWFKGLRLYCSCIALSNYGPVCYRSLRVRRGVDHAFWWPRWGKTGMTVGTRLSPLDSLTWDLM